MARTVDAVIIGAGVIGASIGHQLALTGRKTLNIDQLPAAGYGPTSNSCGIIRVHYSTRTGVALAHEGYHCWRNWAEHLGADDERGLAEFRDCGCLVIRTGGEDHLSPVLGHLDALGIPYENWDRKAIAARLPFYALERFSPPRIMSDPLFGEPSGGMVESAVYFPTAGYVGDPQLATTTCSAPRKPPAGPSCSGAPSPPSCGPATAYTVSSSMTASGSRPRSSSTSPAPTRRGSTAWPGPMRT